MQRLDLTISRICDCVSLTKIKLKILICKKTFTTLRYCIVRYAMPQFNATSEVKRRGVWGTKCYLSFCVFPLSMSVFFPQIHTLYLNCLRHSQNDNFFISLLLPPHSLLFSRDGLLKAGSLSVMAIHMHAHI